jgi:hypothetical protein
MRGDVEPQNLQGILSAKIILIPSLNPQCHAKGHYGHMIKTIGCTLQPISIKNSNRLDFMGFVPHVT